MPSLNKTPNIGLNQWNGNEYPKRQDFADDNVKIDEAIAARETPTGAQSKATTAETNAKAYTDTKLAELIAAAPAALDTLKELSAALGNDPNFATTVLNAIGLKADKSVVESHLADIASQAVGKGASMIGVQDVNNRFAGTNVEAVLNELFQFANDGKTSVANVVGSPITATETFTQIANDIQTQKNNLASNLTAKGQSSVGTETLAELVAKVANVITGIKRASGTTTIGEYGISITGLGFHPKVVILEWHDINNGCYVYGLYSEYTNNNCMYYYYLAAKLTPNNNYKEIASNTDGFTALNGSGLAGKSVKWFACE